MTEAAPSASRVAMSIAFKRARRKFPKNLGVTIDTEEPCHSSEDEDLYVDRKNIEGPSIEYKTESMSNQLESSLTDSFKEIDISEKTDALCDSCRDDYDQFKNVQGNASTLHLSQNYDNDCGQQEQLSENFVNIENISTHNTSSNVNEQNYTIHENHRFGLIWKEESDNYNRFDSEIETEGAPEISQKYCDRHSASFNRRKKHRCKKQSKPSRSSYMCTPSSDYACSESRLHSSNCSYYNHCIHCQHFIRHCCCCSCHCFCNPCCFNCQFWNSTERQEVIASKRKCSSHHRSKKDRYVACKKQSSNAKISSQFRDTCSRDSGMYTNVRYENENYDEENDSSTNPLLHKDSLSILQKKYASNDKRGEEKYNTIIGDKYLSRRCDRSDALEEDEYNYRNLKNRKISKHFFKYSNSF